MEAAVLGACLLEKGAMARLIGIVETEHFYYPSNQVVFQTMQEMWDSGLAIDLLTVTAEIYRKGRQGDFVDSAPLYVTRLTNHVVNSTHLEQHALYIRQMYAERECLRIQMQAGSGDVDAVTRMQDIQDQIQKILGVKGTDDWHDMATVMLKLSKHMDNVRGKDMLGINTGFPSLDKLTSGWQPGQLVVIGARPSVGKSAFVSGIVTSAAKKGHKCGIINLEMPEEQVGGRIASFYSDIEFWRIYRARPRDSEQEQYIYQVMSEVATLPIWISDKTNVSGADIRAKAYKLKNRVGLDLLVIDYLQLIEADGKNNETREREVARLSRSLKLLAMDLKIPVIVLCQLNRESEKQGSKKPRMSNIRESGAIEQDADVVALLHRDWKAGILQDAQGNSTERQADIIIEKNRNGSTMELPVSFDPDTMKFYEGGTAAPAEEGNWRPVQTEAPF